ncbi:mannonate dehydratase [Psychrosphaera sp. B3R10]|uniref:mannonate dehydratase n=1 Tax=unclassified Psychrosphaera TaxID=2641570 RepID=UPI001C088462|nr:MULTISPECIES: mannonate dehydratase [unclassified Psychrosphaera]MBU2881041.1 mannonate dehydratase [Psychrosphaera sp. I2R16]MBU2989965.1 mannonate dehydratase [Psychrosphaera sp. B3R10]MDO6719144.1 mannonate dehydratase [Psychrosphaera sp. 1_MG-2023]
MKETWRWFGPNDSITLDMIVQTGASGIVTAMHEVPTGECWTYESIVDRKKLIEASGLEWTVVESVPVHNDIKTRTGDFKRYIENYNQTLINLGKAGVDTVCYNFMPVVDWTRTNLNYKLPNKSFALRFEMTDFVAYDVFVLNRKNARNDYKPEVIAKAKTRLNNMNAKEVEELEKNIIAGLPGGEGSYSRESILIAINEFIELGTEGLRQNLFSFLEEIMPTAESAGIKMCIHPDDPPFSLFGLPRVVSTQSDAQAIIDAVPSSSNGLTLCAGSYGARGDNDLVCMANAFAERIYFVHLRNVIREVDGSFFESEHLCGDNDMVGLIQALLKAETTSGNSIPMRPDHGHLLADEIGAEGVKPGYSYQGRMKGLAELRGVMHALEQLK